MLQVILAAILIQKMMEDCEIRGFNIVNGSMNIILCRLLRSWRKMQFANEDTEQTALMDLGQLKPEKLD